GAKEDARGPWLVAASVFRVCAGACARTHWLRFSRESILRDTLLSVSSVSAGAPPSFDHIPKNKQASTFRILALGGSTTRDVSLKKDDRYPAVLERILQERYPTTRIEVLNGGMDWYTTEHALIQYAFGASDWNPDLVVFFEGINDLCRSCASPQLAVGEYKSDYSHFYGPVIRAYHTPAFESWLVQPIARVWYSDLRRQPEPID